jgi:hypothetical protein
LAIRRQREAGAFLRFFIEAALIIAILGCNTWKKRHPALHTMNVASLHTRCSKRIAWWPLRDRLSPAWRRKGRGETKMAWRWFNLVVADCPTGIPAPEAACRLPVTVPKRIFPRLDLKKITPSALMGRERSSSRDGAVSCRFYHVKTA